MPRLPLTNVPCFSYHPLTATQHKGMVYEAKVWDWLSAQAAQLGWAFYDHPWLMLGTGVCQPDFLLIAPSGCILLVEAKLTECDCRAQTDMYKQALDEFDVIALQVARRVTSKPTVDCFENTIDNGLMLLWL